MRFAFIAAEKAQHSVTILCRCLRVTPGGFYALPSNMGHFRRDRIGLLPEAGGHLLWCGG